jgi:hypothetical protein
MRTQEQASPAQMTLIGIGLGIAGLLGVLIGFEIVPVPGGRTNLHGPLWIATLLGGIALLAGASCLVQGIGRANTSAELPADAPFWLRVAQYLIGVAMFAGFALLGTWVAVGGDARYFSGGIPFLGAGHISFARIAFGFGALICWLATVAYAVKGARKLMRRQQASPG